MPKFEISDPINMVRSHCGTKIYMASHPALRSNMRGVNRPKHFGDKVWGASLHLVEYLEHISANHVLDIGCGWGLVGIHIARTINANVTCTDLDDCLEAIVLAHATLNEVAITFSALGFNDLLQTDLNHDLIVGSDICFSDETVKQLIELIDHAQNCKARRIIIADIGRPDFTDLVNHCQKKYECNLKQVDDTKGNKQCFILDINLLTVRK
jgi:predicted nicotinamide N-methyase